MTVPHFPPSLAPTASLLGPRGIVVHTTGAGLHSSAAKHKRGAFEQAVRLYSENMAEGPHIVIDHDTLRVGQIQYMDRKAHHVGTLKPGQLQAQCDIGWWNGVFPQMGRVGHHPLWYTGSVNAVTWGVEVIPPAANPSGPWTDDAVELVFDVLKLLLTGGEGLARTGAAKPVSPLAQRQPIDRLTIATHSELSPFTRTTKQGQPWDLCFAQVRQLDGIVAELAHVLQQEDV